MPKARSTESPDGEWNNRVTVVGSKYFHHRADLTALGLGLLLLVILQFLDQDKICIFLHLLQSFVERCSRHAKEWASKARFGPTGETIAVKGPLYFMQTAVVQRLSTQVQSSGIKESRPTGGSTSRESQLEMDCPCRRRF